MPPRHRFLEPIHNVKEEARTLPYRRRRTRGDLVSSSNRKAGKRALQHATAASTADGGAYRDRTDDLMLAKQPLSQLS